MKTKLFFLITVALLVSVSGVFAHETDPAITMEARGFVGQSFVLDGSRSLDDGRALGWKQTEGPFEIRLASGAKITIVPPSAGIYEFELIATDRAGIREVIKAVRLTVVQQTQTNTGGTQDINIGVGESSLTPVILEVEPIEGDSGRAAPRASQTPKPSGSGNVEYDWKVEEGEKAPGIEPDDIDANTDVGITPDFSILLGGSGGDDEESRNEALGILKQGMEEADRPVESLSLNYGKLIVKINQDLRLFGLIPVKANTDVEIDAEQKVKVKFPWWGFMASGKNPELGEKVFNVVSNVLKTKHDTIKNSIKNIR